MPTNTQDMSNTSENINISTCANCGKGEEADINLKSCNACMMVKYCSRDCQIAHRPQHKKECKKRAKELHDEKLFKQPPPEEDCPICMIKLPLLRPARVYMVCCGKVICRGCIHAVRSRATKLEDDICPFCRQLPSSGDDEVIKRYEKRIEMNDPRAMFGLGGCYAEGLHGVTPSHNKALKLHRRAAALGFPDANFSLSCFYKNGSIGVERDDKKAIHYAELAAMGGNVIARANLGRTEGNAGNTNRALKHYLIAARGGDVMSVKLICEYYSTGYATKDDYEKALRYHQEYLDEIKSDQRDEAAAFNNDYRYYESTF